MEFQITQHNKLDNLQIAKIKTLIAQVAIEDGMSPLGEHVLIHLHHGGDDEAIHLLAWDSGHSLIGYLHLDVTDEVAGPAAEVAVIPSSRGKGVGTALVHHAEEITNGQAIRLWAHGINGTAHLLASTLGYAKIRELWQMRRSLFSEIPAVAVDDGISIRNFIPSQDESEWLALNREIFAEHPEQGSWTAADLAVRMKEAWFDPNGFFLALNAADQIVGFSWTKIHGGHKHGDHQHPEIGEIYVLGVSPQLRRSGLGKALTVKSLEYLRDQGLPATMLYVESENQTAISLYESVGFTHWDTDIMFRKTD